MKPQQRQEEVHQLESIIEPNPSDLLSQSDKDRPTLLFPINYNGATYVYKEESLEQLLNEGLVQQLRQVPVPVLPNDNFQPLTFLNNNNSTSTFRMESPFQPIQQQQELSFIPENDWEMSENMMYIPPQSHDFPQSTTVLNPISTDCISQQFASRRNSCPTNLYPGQLRSCDQIYHHPTHSSHPILPMHPTRHSFDVHSRPEKITKARKTAQQRRHSISYIPLEKYTKRSQTSSVGSTGGVLFEDNEYNEFKIGTHETQKAIHKNNEKNYKFTVIEFE